MRILHELAAAAVAFLGRVPTALTWCWYCKVIDYSMVLIYILEDLDRWLFPILMSAGKVQYFCHLPLLWVHYNKKEALKSVFI